MSFDPRQPEHRRAFGLAAETLAADFLARRGLRILFRNYTCPLGELDIIARDGNTVVFVEVRSTASGEAVWPALSINAHKQSRLRRLAEYFLNKHRLQNQPARLDVVLVVENTETHAALADAGIASEQVIGQGGKPTRIVHYVNALRFSG